MEIRLLKLLLFEASIFSFKDFMKKYNLKDATMNESDLQKKITRFLYILEIGKYIQIKDSLI